MEEELPPGFWEEAQEPHPPSAGVRRQVKARPDEQPSEEVSATGRPAGAEERMQAAGGSRRAGASSDRRQGTEEAGDDVHSLDDPGFETLRALFPGRIVSIEASEAAETEEEQDTSAADGESAAGGESALNGEAGDSDNEEAAAQDRQE